MNSFLMATMRKAGLVNLGQNGAGRAVPDRVRLDDAQRALRHSIVAPLECLFRISLYGKAVDWV
jgi:hypothetical protein